MAATRQLQSGSGYKLPSFPHRTWPHPTPPASAQQPHLGPWYGGVESGCRLRHQGCVVESQWVAGRYRGLLFGQEACLSDEWGMVGGGMEGGREVAAHSTESTCQHCSAPRASSETIPPSTHQVEVDAIQVQLPRLVQLRRHPCCARFSAVQHGGRVEAAIQHNTRPRSVRSAQQGGVFIPCDGRQLRPVVPVG